MSPIVDKLKDYAKFCVENPTQRGNAWRADRTAGMLYGYVKFRGYKTISLFLVRNIVLNSFADKP